MGTGHVLNIKASRDSGPFFCEAENAIGSGRSNISQIDVHSKYHKWSLVFDVNCHLDLSPFVHRLLVTNFNQFPVSVLIGKIVVLNTETQKKKVTSYKTNAKYLDK